MESSSAGSRDSSSDNSYYDEDNSLMSSFVVGYDGEDSLLEIQHFIMTAMRIGSSLSVDELWEIACYHYAKGNISLTTDDDTVNALLDANVYKVKQEVAIDVLCQSLNSEDRLATKETGNSEAVSGLCLSDTHHSDNEEKTRTALQPLPDYMTEEKLTHSKGVESVKQLSRSIPSISSSELIQKDNELLTVSLSNEKHNGSDNNGNRNSTPPSSLVTQVSSACNVSSGSCVNAISTLPPMKQELNCPVHSTTTNDSNNPCTKSDSNNTSTELSCNMTYIQRTTISNNKTNPSNVAKTETQGLRNQNMCTNLKSENQFLELPPRDRPTSLKNADLKIESQSKRFSTESANEDVIERNCITTHALTLSLINTDNTNSPTNIAKTMTLSLRNLNLRTDLKSENHSLEISPCGESDTRTLKNADLKIESKSKRFSLESANDDNIERNCKDCFNEPNEPETIISNSLTLYSNTCAKSISTTSTLDAFSSAVSFTSSKDGWSDLQPCTKSIKNETSNLCKPEPDAVAGISNVISTEHKGNHSPVLRDYRPLMVSTIISPQIYNKDCKTAASKSIKSSWKHRRKSKSPKAIKFADNNVFDLSASCWSQHSNNLMVVVVTDCKFNSKSRYNKPVRIKNVLPESIYAHCGVISPSDPRACCPTSTVSTLQPGSPCLKHETPNASPCLQPDKLYASPSVQDTPNTSPFVQTDAPYASPSVQPDAPNASPSIQPDIPNASPSVQPDIANASPSEQPDIPNAFPSVQPDIANASPSVQPDTPNASPSVQPDTPNASPSDQPDTPKASPSVQPDAPNASPSIQPDTPKASPSEQPDAPNASPSIQPDIPNASPSVQPDIANASPSVQPDIANASPSVQPDIANAFPSVQPDASNASPSMHPDTPNAFPSVQPDTPNASPSMHPDTPNASPSVQPGTPNASPSMLPDTPNASPSVQPGTPNASPTMHPDTPNASPSVQPGTPNASPSMLPDTPNASPSVQPDIPNESPSLLPDTPNASPYVQPDTLYVSPSIQPDTPYTSSFQQTYTPYSLSFWPPKSPYGPSAHQPETLYALSYQQQNTPWAPYQPPVAPYTLSFQQAQARYGSANQLNMSYALSKQATAYASTFQQPNISYASFQQQNSPYTLCQRPSTPYASVQQPNTLYASFQIQDTLYASSQQKNTPYASSQQKDTPHTSSQQKNIPYALSQQPNKPYASSRQKDIPIASSQQKDTPYASSYQKDTPYTSYQQKDSLYASSQLNDTPYASSQLNDTPYASSQEMGTPFALTQQPNTPYASTQQPNILYDSTQIKDSQHASCQKKDTTYALTQPKDTTYASSQPKDTPYASSQPIDTPYALPPQIDTPLASSQLKDTPFTSYQIKDTPYTSTQQKDIPYTSSQKKVTPYASYQKKVTPYASSQKKVTPYASSQKKDTPYALSQLHDTLKALSHHLDTLNRPCLSNQPKTYALPFHQPNTLNTSSGNIDLTRVPLDLTLQKNKNDDTQSKKVKRSRDKRKSSTPTIGHSDSKKRRIRVELGGMHQGRTELEENSTTGHEYQHSGIDQTKGAKKHDDTITASLLQIEQDKGERKKKQRKSIKNDDSNMISGQRKMQNCNPHKKHMKGRRSCKQNTSDSVICSNEDASTPILGIKFNRLATLEKEPTSSSPLSKVLMCRPEESIENLGLHFSGDNKETFQEHSKGIYHGEKVGMKGDGKNEEKFELDGVKYPNGSNNVIQGRCSGSKKVSCSKSKALNQLKQSHPSCVDAINKETKPAMLKEVNKKQKCLSDKSSGTTSGKVANSERSYTTTNIMAKSTSSHATTKQKLPASANQRNRQDEKTLPEVRQCKKDRRNRLDYHLCSKCMVDKSVVEIIPPDNQVKSSNCLKCSKALNPKDLMCRFCRQCFPNMMAYAGHVYNLTVFNTQYKERKDYICTKCHGAFACRYLFHRHLLKTPCARVCFSCEKFLQTGSTFKSHKCKPV